MNFPIVIGGAVDPRSNVLQPSVTLDRTNGGYLCTMAPAGVTSGSAPFSLALAVAIYCDDFEARLAPLCAFVAAANGGQSNSQSLPPKALAPDAFSAACGALVALSVYRGRPLTAVVSTAEDAALIAYANTALAIAAQGRGAAGIAPGQRFGFLQT